MYRVMIVDDEPMIRKGLINFIDWRSMDCEIIGESGDGIDARDALPSLLPDIIVLDIKMPGLDGIELSRYIHENYPCIKVIILTGYADFTYAQSAIKYGVIDFVLKPTSTEKILAAVNKAKSLLLEQQSKESKLIFLEREVSNHLDEVREKFILDVVNNVLQDPKKIEDKMKQLHIHIENYYVIIFETENSPLVIHHPCSEEYNRFITSIRNFLSMAFKDYQHYIAFITRQQLCMLVSFPKDDPSECMQKIMVRCEEILSMVNNFMDFSISIGISALHKTVREIPSAYAEAVKSLFNKFYNDSQIFIFSNYHSNQSPAEYILTNKLIDHILDNIKLGKCTEALCSMNELLEKEKALKLPIDHIKTVSIQICSLCSKLLGNYNLSLPDVLENGDNIYEMIIQSKTLGYLSNILTSVITSVCLSLSSSHRQNNYIVKKAMEYIEENYSQNLKLQSVAEFVHVNGSYLSRVFRKETGETLTEAITRYRVEKAKEIIANGGIKAYEVASIVGFNDPAYFSYVFKKYTGISLTEYKSIG